MAVIAAGEVLQIRQHLYGGLGGAMLFYALWLHMKDAEGHGILHHSRHAAPELKPAPPERAITSLSHAIHGQAPSCICSGPNGHSRLKHGLQANMVSGDDMAITQRPRQHRLG